MNLLGTLLVFFSFPSLSSQGAPIQIPLSLSVGETIVFSFNISEFFYIRLVATGTSTPLSVVVGASGTSYPFNRNACVFFPPGQQILQVLVGSKEAGIPEELPVTCWMSSDSAIFTFYVKDDGVNWKLCNGDWSCVLPAEDRLGRANNVTSIALTFDSEDPGPMGIFRCCHKCSC